MNRRLTSLAIGLVAALSLAASAWADTLETTDGRLIQGRYMGGTQNTVRFETDTGVQVFPMDQVVAVTMGSTEAAAPAPTAQTPTAQAPAAQAPAAGGQTLTSLPAGSRQVYVDNQLYYYADGVFYQPTVGGYVLVTAPAGARLVALPPARVVVTVGSRPYYYYRGIYYEWLPGPQVYVVVQAPIGALVFGLPFGAFPIYVGGVRHYHWGGVLYRPYRHGSRWGYRVVGPWHHRRPAPRIHRRPNPPRSRVMDRAPRRQPPVVRRTNPPRSRVVDKAPRYQPPVVKRSAPRQPAKFTPVKPSGKRSKPVYKDSRPQNRAKPKIISRTPSRPVQKIQRAPNVRRPGQSRVKLGDLR